VLNDIKFDGQSVSMPLPPFFSHLLPEGKLRTYLAQRAGIKETQEFRLLTALRDDLPGAVILKPDLIPASNTQTALETTVHQAITDQPLRFSLAGFQMKFSANFEDDRLTIPARGIGGHWILKLPSSPHPHLIELEYSMLLLAKRIGISVPEFRLVPIEEIENLPSNIPEALQGNCLISKRFDRTADGGRIHMEDFAQVFALQDKYDPSINYQSIANVIWQEIGPEAILEYIRRLVYMVFIGNADMHLKNWSLIYPDGVNPRLAPAYDFVATIVYVDIDRKLAHKIAGVRDFDKVNVDTFRNLAKIAKLPERPVVNIVLETIDAIKEHWLAMKNDLPIPSSFRRLIDEHMVTVPLAKERATPIPISDPIPLNMTWPGSFINWEIQLDYSIASGMILYKNQAGTSVGMDAPRRMNHVLIQKQTHQILVQRQDFANQLIVGYVGLKLYDEWRDESFIRIEARMVEGGLDETKVNQPELNIRVSFFPISWRNIQKHISNKQQVVVVDFVLNNWELCTSQATIASLPPGHLEPNGIRTADLRLYLQKTEKLYIIPPENRLIYGSGRFGFKSERG
jgi:serine/threonine-protein kinase HipA